MPTAVHAVPEDAPNTSLPSKPSPEEWKPHVEVTGQRTKDVWTVLIVLRLLNSLTLGTYFQPDEFFQALEPAWALAFGTQSGAWLTWEWTHQLRSSLHPVILSIPYILVSGLSSIMSFPPTFRAQLLLLAPKILPALSAATMDYFTWRLAERVYGIGSSESIAALSLAALSPWQWFFSTRTFSNNLEAALTTIALFFWPWDWMRSTGTMKSRRNADMNLRFCFMAAGLASILRPTNVMIWIILAIFTLPHLNMNEILAMIRNAVIYGSVTLVIATLSDFIYYGNWQSSIFNFIRYNITEGLADFYGLNRADYYLTEAFPQLLTTALPFVGYGLIQAMFYRTPAKSSDSKGEALSDGPSTPILRSLAAVALGVPLVFSFVGHKEVRFMYPILPVLLILGARPLAAFYGEPSKPKTTSKKVTLGSLLALNILIAAFFAHFYGRGVIDVATYLRQEFESHNHKLVLGTMNNTDTLHHMSVGFLMPCHSTPWRSRLIWPEIDAWALTCEPPVGLDIETRTIYVDEADQFYSNPQAWLKEELQPLMLSGADTMSMSSSSRREWPEYVVFFEQLEETIKGVLQGSRYQECWRGSNTGWHYDWRRAGDVVVYCEDRGTKAKLVVKKEDMADFMQFF